MTFIDKIENRFPALFNFIIKFYEKRKTTTFHDILLCIAITLSCAFYEFENFIPLIAADLIRKVLLILFIICWLWCAFLNGFWKKYYFLIFTVLFWIIPRIFIIIEDSMGIREYNKYFDAVAQYSRLTVQFSIDNFSELLNLSIITSTITLIAWCLLFFFVGIWLKNLLGNYFRGRG